MRTRTLQNLIAIAALAVSLPCRAADPGPEWEPGEKKQAPGYTYQVFSQQKEDEPFVRFMVRGEIDAPAELVARTASRVSSDPAFAPKDQTRTILFKDDDETVLLTEIDLPAMFSDREVLTRGVSSVDPATGVRRVDFETTEHPSAPRREGVIRLERTGGYWQFVPEGAKSTRVTFESFVDLGGSLPLWFVSGAMATNAAASFENVANECVPK